MVLVNVLYSNGLHVAVHCQSFGGVELGKTGERLVVVQSYHVRSGIVWYR